MSSGSAPNWGWVLEATHENFLKLKGNFSDEQLGNWLTSDGQEASDDMIEKLRLEVEQDPETYIELLDFVEQECGPIAICVHKTCVSVWPLRYSSDEGDRYDQLDDGKYYFSFDHSDLFKPSLFAEALQNDGVMPEEKGWTNYG